MSAANAAVFRAVIRQDEKRRGPARALPERSAIRLVKRRFARKADGHGCPDAADFYPRILDFMQGFSEVNRIPYGFSFFSHKKPPVKDETSFTNGSIQELTANATNKSPISEREGPHTVENERALNLLYCRIALIRLNVRSAAVKRPALYPNEEFRMRADSRKTIAQIALPESDCSASKLPIFQLRPHLLNNEYKFRIIAALNQPIATPSSL